MPLYETVFIARPDLSEEEVDGIIERVTGLVKNDGGEVTNVERWGKRKLAYRVKKERHGNYVMLHYEGKPETTLEVERLYRISEQIIKYMTIRIKTDQPIRIEMEREDFEEEARPARAHERPKPRAPEPPAAEEAGKEGEDRAKVATAATESGEAKGDSGEGEESEPAASASTVAGEQKEAPPASSEKQEES